MKVKTISRAIGMVLLIDGVSAMIAPVKYLRKLETGTPLLDDILDFFAENPDMTRGFAVAEITLGAWLTLR